MMKWIKKLEPVAYWLVVLGALNWGLYLFNYNLVNAILGSMPFIENAVYAIIGLSAIVLIINKFK